MAQQPAVTAPAEASRAALEEAAPESAESPLMNRGAPPAAERPQAEAAGTARGEAGAEEEEAGPSDPYG